jgi:sporadic carbohydrate cluster protein (TIGR04323 family)
VTRLRGYIFGRPFMGERVPQHIQNLVLRDYARRKGVTLLLAASEYAIERSHLVLGTVLDELDQIDGVLAYSLFQLPEGTSERLAVLERFVGTGKAFHCAVEELVVEDRESAAHAEMVWLIRKSMSGPELRSTSR